MTSGSWRSRSGADLLEDLPSLDRAASLEIRERVEDGRVYVHRAVLAAAGAEDGEAADIGVVGVVGRVDGERAPWEESFSSRRRGRRRRVPGCPRADGGPGLRVEIDLHRRVAGFSEPDALVGDGGHVPVAVPGVLLEGGSSPGGSAGSAPPVACPVASAQSDEFQQREVEGLGEPDADALALHPTWFSASDQSPWSMRIRSCQPRRPLSQSTASRACSKHAWPGGPSAQEEADLLLEEGHIAGLFEIRGSARAPARAGCRCTPAGRAPARIGRSAGAHAIPDTGWRRPVSMVPRAASGAKEATPWRPEHVAIAAVVLRITRVSCWTLSFSQRLVMRSTRGSGVCTRGCCSSCRHDSTNFANSRSAAAGSR